MRRHPVQRAVKRVLDPVAAAAGLVVLSPVYAGIAVAVLVDSGRPVIFVSPRSGLEGRSFGMLKFRSMIPDAVAVGREQGISEDPFGIVKGDPRITRVGRWLRRTGLDELPQLVNVLRGQMSLVGPRADLVEQAAAYAERERRRLSVRPGITGWAQVNGRDSLPWTERFELDLWYLDNWSLWLDAKILLRTVGEVFRAEPEPIEDTLNIERAKKRASGS
ncbi:MAG TPA: sugar transferase [Gaiellaceae bacterium]|nr:sugar transferase [Gaiellaceae bacterium]